MKKPDTLPIIAFASQQDWENWLQEHHTDQAGLWLKLAKKGSGIPTVTYEEAVEVALCFGWIDGQSSSLDDHYWLQKFTPRRPKSVWSQVNRERALRLQAEGKMQPAGWRHVEAAQADGRWEAAYSTAENARVVPDDFQAALDQHPAAREFFLTLNKTNRSAIIYRLNSVKRAETRVAKIQMFIEMLARKETIYP